MKINKLIRLFWMVIFFIFPLAVFAASDSTNPDIIPPAVTSQCFTVKVKDKILHIAPESVTADVKVLNCTWRGQNKASWWTLGVANSVYEQSCASNEVAFGVRHGVRGVFGAYGEFDLYVNCCQVEATFQMSQNWVECPGMTTPA